MYEIQQRILYTCQNFSLIMYNFREDMLLIIPQSLWNREIGTGVR